MADYRTVKVSMWAQDEWFMDLPIDGKLLWVYLFTNGHTSVCGLYKLPLRTILFETGLSKDRALELLDNFATCGKAKYADGVVWVTKMREHQGSASPQVVKRIRKDLDTILDTPLKREYLSKYGIDTVSIGYLESRSETDTDTDTDRSRTPPVDNLEVQDQMVAQWRAILGDTLTPAMFPEVKQYMDKLQARGIVDWWLLALKETTKANRPSWQYMKVVLETWLAAGAPSIAKNGTDPTKRIGVAPIKSPTEQAEADARQAAYELEIAAQLAAAGMLPQ